MADQIRQPNCSACPLNGQKKVWGVGPLDAEVLVLAEAPGPTEVEEGIPLIGPTGQRVNALLGQNGFKREEVRIENTFQCKALATSKEGRQAQEACGPSIWQVIDNMPNLKAIYTFGGPAVNLIRRGRSSREAT